MKYSCKSSLHTLFKLLNLTSVCVWKKKVTKVNYNFMREKEKKRVGIIGQWSPPCERLRVFVPSNVFEACG